MDLLTGISATSGALNSQRTRLDIIAQNIANARTTRSPEGGPYQRRVVNFESELIRSNGSAFGAKDPGLATVRVAGVTIDPTHGPTINDPGHPDADAQGMVTLPNVNLAFEMVDLITASRAYEANLNVAKNSRQMAMRTLEIGK